MSAAIQVIGRPLLLGGERIEHVGRHGQTILQMIEEGIGAPLGEEGRRRGRVQIGGTVVPPELWHRVRPKQGTILNFTLGIPEGGNIFRAVLMLAVVVAAVYAGPLVAGWALGTTAAAVAAGTSAVSAATFGAASALATGIIGFAGMQLLNALVPMRPPALSGSTPSPTYSISGGRNIANPYGPVPVLLGRHKITALYGARAYTEVVGSEQYLRQFFAPCYGPISIQDIKNGETPIGEFDDFEIEVREGLPTDAPVTLYPGQVLEDQFSIRLEEEADWSVRRSSADADELSVDWAFPQGLVKYSDKGKPKETSGVVAIEMRLVGTADWVPVAEIDTSEKKEEPFRVGHRWTVTRGQYDVRMRCVQDESQAQNIEWTALRTIRAKPPFTFPFPIAQIALRIKAQGQLNGIVDELNFIGASRCPDWDLATGTWITRETSNPASLYRYVQQHPANARRLTDAQIAPILPDLQDWHDYCRVLGLEFNQIRDFKTALPDVLADIAATGHATPHWKEGLRSIVIDRPRATVVQMVTPENSWGFEGQQDYRELPDAWRIRFVDRQGDWDQNAERIVPRQGFTEETAQDFETAEFPGETDARRIWIDGRRRFLELEKRAQTCSVNMDWESLQVTRGDLVLVAHDVPRWGLAWGKVQEVDAVGAATFVTLSRSVEMVAGKTYVIRFRKPSEIEGTLLRQVATFPGETRSVRLIGPGAVPEVDDLFLFGEPSKEAREMVVKEIEPGDDLTARLILVDHAPEIEGAEEEEPPVWVPREPSPRDDSPAVPVIVSVASGPNVQGVGDDGTVLAAIAVGVAPGSGSPIPTVRYVLRHRLAGTSAWTPVDIPAAVGSARLLAYSPGDTVELTAQAFSAAAKPSLYSPLITHTMQARTTPAPNVATLAAERLPSGWRRFIWTFADPEGNGLPPDLAGLELRYRAGTNPGWTFDDLLPLHSGLLSNSPWETSAPAAAGIFTFGAVGRLRDGNPSATPKIITATLGHGVPPSVPTISTPSPFLTADATPNISGTGVTGALAHVMVDGVAMGSAPVIGEVWTATLAPVADGAHAVTAIVVDGDGNPSGPSAAITMVVDTAAPGAPTISNVSPMTGADTTPPFSGGGETGCMVQLYRGGSTPAAAPVAVVGGAWATDLNALAIGGYTITAVQTDAAGNPSPASTPVTLNIVPPSIAIGTPAGGTSTYDRRQTCTGTGAIAGATIKLYSGVTQYGTSTADGSGNWSLTPSSDIPLGTNSYFVTQTVNGQEGAAGAATSLTVVAIDADAWAWIAAMTVRPDFARQTLIKTMVGSLKTAGVWAKLDTLYLLAAHDAQAARLNAKAPPTFGLTATSSPVYTTDRGYKGAGSGVTAGGYLASGFDPATAGGNFAQDSASLFVWVRTAATAATAVSCEIGNTQARIFTKAATAGDIVSRMNDVTNTTVAAGTPNSTGLFCLSRAAGGSYARYHDATALAAASVASTGIASAPIDILRASAATHSDAEVCAAGWGGALTATDEVNLYAALHAYLQGVGAVV